MTRTLGFLDALLALLLIGGTPAQSQGSSINAGDAVCGPIGADGPTQSGQRVAVLIGINEYADPQIRDLGGAVNDICLIRQLLVSRYGFAPVDIVVLTDAHATRARVLAAIDRELIARAGRNATALIYFSGHGSQVFDTSGDERRDRLDEAIVPSDARRDGLRAILDDELSVVFRRVSARVERLVVAFDSCHSGDATRDVGVARRIDQRHPHIQGESITDASGLPYLFISAARSNQLAYEAPVHGRRFGAFTYALASTLNEATPSITYRDVVLGARARLATSGRATQTPTLEGPGVTQTFLALAGTAAASGVPVWRDHAGALWIAIGAVQGVAAGARFRLTSTDTVAGETIAAITQLGDFTSRLELVSGQPPGGGIRGSPLDFVGVETRIVIGLDASLTAEDRARADALFAEQLSFTGASADDAVDFVLARDGDTLALLGPDGAVMTEAADVVRALEHARRWVRWRRLAELTDSGVGVAIDVGLVGGAGAPADTAALAGALELRDGDPFWVVVANRSAGPLFIGVLDLGSQGAIAAVFPNATDAITPLAPGETRRLPLQAVLDNETVSASQIKVFASREPIDFTVLEQDRLRGRPLNALEHLLADARGNRRGSPTAIESWSARDLHVVIEAR